MLSSAKNRNVSNNCEIRIERGKNKIPFHIAPADDGLRGMSQTDLVVLAGYSGSGKTETALHIAMTNAELGIKVYYFALEAYEGELEDRILYKLMAKLFFDDPNRPRVSLDFESWSDGQLPELISYDLQAQELYKTKYKNLFTFYKAGDFTVNDLKKEFAMAKADGMELGIVDHSHYFDWGDKSEYTALNEIIKVARDLTLIHNVPMILISHLRKADKKFVTLAPEPDEIHGSSELFKRCTKMILLGPGEHHASERSVDTFVLLGKNRRNSSVTRYVSKLRFNYERNTYEKKYEVGKNVRREQGFESLVGADVPKWCSSIHSSSHHQNATNVSRPVDDKSREPTAVPLPYKD